MGLTDYLRPLKLFPGNLILARFVIGTSFFASPAINNNTNYYLSVSQYLIITVVYVPIVIVKPLLEVVPNIWGRLSCLSVLMDASRMLPCQKFL